MKKYFLKAASLAALVLAVNVSVFAQDPPAPPPPPVIKSDNHEEIIISKKGDKDVKLTVEIKDGQIYINGKKTDEFNDDNISIHKRIKREFNGDFSFSEPASPFENGTYGYGYSSDNDEAMNMFSSDSKTAFLGVSSEKAADGGAKIIEITKASPAEKSGLQKGDVITKINETQIETPEDLSKAIHTYKVEDKVTVTFKRDNKEQKVTAVLGKFKGVFTKSFSINMPDMAELQKMKGYGAMDEMRTPRAFSIRADKPKIGIKAQDTEDGKGVKVLDVDDESPADKAGIKEDDIITEFDGKIVNSADALAEASRAAKDKNAFKVKFKRDDKQQEVEIKIPKKLKTADL